MRALLPALLAPLAAGAGVPLQHFYDAGSAERVAGDAGSGCVLTHWAGTDEAGTEGYPWMARIDCSNATAEYRASGVAVHGHLRFYAHSGVLTVNGRALQHPGSAHWSAPRTRLALSLSPGGSAWVVGARYELDERAAPAAFTSSWNASRHRAYSVADAVAGRQGGVMRHDPHIMNGTADAKDLLWASATGADPPSVVVINCAAGASFVDWHSHPQGAVYLPLAGRICFRTDRDRCVGPGAARWTSPNLYYYETFAQQPTADAGAAGVAAMAGMGGCPNPVLFAVTNFDPAHPAGEPNFADVPPNAERGGRGRGWGYFRNLAVRPMLPRTAVVDAQP
eukprot:TRINITY_DN13595_c0_g1_i1.p2 TRINITY_DN13595_c0_g1~~TRINITY_DN13595_c0_g1_i1.p2  ORF type:complete len:361 (+),score=103.90 TRINITY_DN13595_c0_g1_i1:73-1083(+)